MHEEKSSSLRRSAMPQHTHGVSGGASSVGGPSHMLSTAEARLSSQVAQAAALAAQSAPASSLHSDSSSSSSLPSNLPSSSGTTHLRSSAAATAAASGINGTTAAGGSVELNPLDWAEVQFKRAGVGSSVMPTATGFQQTPIQNLGMQQRLRHAQLFGVVEKLREGQQHIFLEQFNQFPNVESHTADDYSKIWSAFKNKDEEAQHIIMKLNGLCDNIDTLNKHAQQSHG